MSIDVLVQQDRAAVSGPAPAAVTITGVQQREMPLAYRVIAGILRPTFTAITRRRWRGAEHLPADTGFIAAGNHVTNLDPITFAHFLYDHGAPPKYLAKSELFAVPVLGALLVRARQIPVYRGTTQAGDSLRAAREALAAGECVAVFPEGTLTRDPDLWPMAGKTGIARLALSVRVPVIPIAQWGAHRIMPRYRLALRVLPRKQVEVVAGPPVMLDDLYGHEHDPAALREATDRIMTAITDQLAEIRGEQPPERPYDVRRDGDPYAEAKAARKAAQQSRRAARRAAAASRVAKRATRRRKRDEDTGTGGGAV